MRSGYERAGVVIAALLMSTALSSGSAVAGGSAADDEIAALKRQMEQMARRIEELEAKQAETKKEVEETRKNAVLTKGSTPGSFVLPGTNTEVEISGYVKADFIYDADENTGDVFVPENITTTGQDNDGFRAHARQSRLRVKTKTPTAWGDLKTHLEGDFFGGGGNQIFSNSTSFRLRHAYATVGGLLAGQTWSNFMPIESYPTTVDFNGPAGLPFVRQAQLRYTLPLGEGLSLSASIENSELSARNQATGAAISESTNLGIRAGVDELPDFTVAARYQSDFGFFKVAGLARSLGSPNEQGDDDFGWGVNVSGNTSLWPGGKILASFTYGEGVGRYLINGFGQDAFFDPVTGDIDAIEAYGVAAQIQQKLTDELTVAVAYGRSEFKDSRLPTDLDNVNTVHGTLLWSPIPRLTFGAEVIWGNREDADGTDDDALRFQGSVQVNF